MKSGHTSYVLGFLFSPDREEVLLIEKTKPPFLAGKLNGVGGKIEPGETAKEAMVREFEEEVGIKTTKIDWEYRLAMHAPTYSIQVFRGFGNLHAAQQMEEEKPTIGNVHWLTHIKIVPNLAWIIPLLLDSTLTEIQDIFLV